MASNAENVSIWWRHHDSRHKRVACWYVYPLVALCRSSFTQPIPDFLWGQQSIYLMHKPSMETYTTITCIHVLLWVSNGDLAVIHCFMGTIQCLYSLCGWMSYLRILWSLKATRLDVVMIALLWNLTSFSAELLPRCLSNFRAIEKV